MTWSRIHLLVPNLITLGRLLAVPVAVWLILTDEMAIAFWLFVAAGISDALDGFFAKQLNARTELGRLLDPLADKALLVSVYITLGHQGYLDVWLVILVVFRDALIVFGVTLSQFLSQPVKVQPLYVSKFNTVVQILLAGLVLANVGLELDADGLATFLVYLVALTTFISGAAYVVRWGRQAWAIEGAPQ